MAQRASGPLGSGGRSTEGADRRRAIEERYLEDPATFVAEEAAAALLYPAPPEPEMSREQIEEERQRLWGR